MNSLSAESLAAALAIIGRDYHIPLLSGCDRAQAALFRRWVCFWRWAQPSVRSVCAC